MIIGLLVIGLIFGSAGTNAQDRVFLKNGRTVEGTVLEHIPAKHVKIKTTKGKTLVIKSAQVKKVELEENLGLGDDVVVMSDESPVQTVPVQTSAPPMSHTPAQPSQFQTMHKPVSGSFNVRGSVGTDIELGIGFGGGASYVWRPSMSGTAFEIGADIFFHHSSGKETEDNTFGETSDWTLSLLVFGVRGNGLFNYYPGESDVYFIAGVGFVVASIDYNEKYYAANYVPGFSYDATETDFEEASAGNVINLGLGLTTGSGLEFRLETPMLFFYSTDGNMTSFVPTATVSVQYRFR
jgi:hypothetical protein